MLSDLRTRKLTRFFRLVDADGDGYFTRADSETIAIRLVALRGHAKGTPAYDAFVGGFLRYWDDVRRDVDASEDGKVSLGEWLHYHAIMLANPARFESSATTSARLMFALLDVDGDGKVTTDEVASWLRAWGQIDEETLATIPGILDINGDGLLSHSEIMSLTREFFFSDDPEARGNWAMGPF
ncbi:MAG: hypothetical protein R3B09_29250 [Nannocystaceae bacterium]